MVNTGNNFIGNQFRRRPINVDLYRPLYFDGIIGHPNHVPIESRDKLHKFVGNNVISAEENLQSFGDIINDYEIAHEDVIMKLFVQSLIEDARDWYRGLPVDSVGLWEEFKIIFQEQYGDKTNVSFMLNEFNNIRKSDNEAVTDFNARFQKAMHRIFQVMRLDENVCLTTYYNAFDPKIAYILRDKNPHSLRDAFRIAINVESNRKASGKVGRQTDVRLWKEQKPQQNKYSKEDYKIEKLISIVKDLIAKVGNPAMPHYN